MPWKILYRAHGIHPLFCFRHIRMPWKILYKAQEIHLNHKENHFFWNFSFKYFAVSIIIHNFALAFNKEAGWLQITPSGEMVEWSITTVLKTVVPRGTGGSNPSLSANKGVYQRVTWFTPFITPKFIVWEMILRKESWILRFLIWVAIHYQMLTWLDFDLYISTLQK